MKKTLLTLCLLFFSACENEYVENYEQTQSFVEQKAEVLNELDDFSLENIWEFDDIELFYTPQSKSFNLIDKIVSQIENADEKVYLSTYIFTEKRIFAALKNAQKKWIDVRVLMEKNVYKAPFLNNNRYEDLESAWVNVAWADPDDYSLNHTKMLIIDDSVIISTGNYSYSSFAYNREFFMQIWDPDFVSLLTDVYLADFAGDIYTDYDERLIMSPLLTRSKFSTLVSSAQESIQIYSQTFSDDTLEQELSEAVQNWIDVEIIFPELDQISSNQESYDIFTKAGVTVHTMKKPKLHAKAMLIDKKYLYLWSKNFSYYSIEENREIWVIITNPEIIDKFLWVYKSDKN